MSLCLAFIKCLVILENTSELVTAEDGCKIWYHNEPQWHAHFYVSVQITDRDAQNRCTEVSRNCCLFAITFDFLRQLSTEKVSCGSLYLMSNLSRFLIFKYWPTITTPIYSTSKKRWVLWLICRRWMVRAVLQNISWAAPSLCDSSKTGALSVQCCGCKGHRAAQHFPTAPGQLHTFNVGWGPSCCISARLLGTTSCALLGVLQAAGHSLQPGQVLQISTNNLKLRHCKARHSSRKSHWHD